MNMSIWHIDELVLWEITTCLDGITRSNIISVLLLNVMSFPLWEPESICLGAILFMATSKARVRDCNAALHLSLISGNWHIQLGS